MIHDYIAFKLNITLLSFYQYLYNYYYTLEKFLSNSKLLINQISTKFVLVNYQQNIGKLSYLAYLEL